MNTFTFCSHLGQEIKKVIKKKRKDIPAEEKKICLWVLDDGTACGKTFTKFDSLKRHVSEAHKGVRPYACTLCGKNYGRRDYLIRHLKSHNEAEVSSISAQRFLGSNNQVVRFLPLFHQDYTKTLYFYCYFFRWAMWSVQHPVPV